MGEVTGEIGVEAESGGRRLTLDPVGGAKDKITIDAWEVESTLAAGFRQNWTEGGDENVEVSLSVGAGCGSRWGTFRYKRKADGAEVDLVFSASDLAYALAALAEQRLAGRAKK